jgi:hypothetical protein
MSVSETDQIWSVSETANINTVSETDQKRTASWHRYINANTDIINMLTFMYAIIYVFTAKLTINRKYVWRKHRIFLLSSKLCYFITLFVHFLTFLYYYHWVDTSAGGLFISESKIRTVVSAWTLTLFIRYIYYCNLQFLNNIIINQS